eukprot:gb/GFBE01077720.1/.p1 GENE.gb/GFBE01077720.1/~~gb/GFBE01077720.1/.p1  ORF type:complete len:581 (+),score=172.88 gb/GFBE01077720.1/:1-1743(+)
MPLPARGSCADLSSLQHDLAKHHRSIEGLLESQLSRVLEGIEALSRQLGCPSESSVASQPPPVPDARPNYISDLACEEAVLRETASGFIASARNTPKDAWKENADGDCKEQAQRPRFETEDSFLAAQDEMVPKSTFRLKLDKAKATGVKEEVERAIKLKSRKSMMPSEASVWSPRQLAIRIVSSPKFEAGSSLLILAAAVLIGVETHMLMQALRAGTLVPDFVIGGIVINSLFTVELLVRITADLSFFLHQSNEAIGWNILDTLLVVTGWVETVLYLVQAASSIIDLETLKLLRLLRLMRILRVVKLVRFFSELRILVAGIFGSLRSLVWAFMLLALIMFVFGSAVMSVIISTLESESPPPASSTAKLMELYGDLPRTMMTLFMSISGGVDWRDAVEPLNSTYWVMPYLFAAYVFFTVFCCLNVVTGIFVDHAKALKDADEEAMHQEATKNRQHWIHEVAKIFTEISESSSGGQLSKEHFIKHLEEEHVQVCFNQLGINIETTNTDELWDLFDMDESGRIDHDEFALGIKQFHGVAKSIDLFKLRRECLKMRKQVQFLKEMHAQERRRRKSTTLEPLSPV